MMGPGSAKSMPSTAEPETPNPTDASSAASGATSSFPRLGSLILKINTKTHPNHTARYVSAYVPGDQGPWDIHSHPCTASGTFRPGGSGEATAASFTVPQDRLFLKAKGLADPDWASATLGTFHEVVDGNPSETPSDAPIFDDWRISSADIPSLDEHAVREDPNPAPGETVEMDWPSIKKPCLVITPSEAWLADGTDRQVLVKVHFGEEIGGGSESGTA